jgi:hypothetical protein
MHIHNQTTLGLTPNATINQQMFKIFKKLEAILLLET